MQPARDLVGVLVEFTAGMQVGHDDLGGRHPLLVMNADRDAAAVIGDGARAVGVQGHGDGVAVAGERLVDRVVDDLVDHVVQAGAVIGVADIHARPLAHGVEAAQHLDRLRVVGRILAIAAPLPFGQRAVIGSRRYCRSAAAAPSAPSGSDAGMFAMSSLVEVSVRTGRGQVPSCTDRNWAAPPQRREQRGVGAGQPCLAVEPEHRLEQRRAAARVEMRRDLVEQQERRLAANRPLQPRMSQQDRDQQRLLFAGRGERRPACPSRPG